MTGFWSYLVEPETNDLRPVDFWLGEPSVRSAEAVFSVDYPSSDGVTPLMRLDLATGEVRQLAEVPEGATLVVASRSQVIVRIGSELATANSDEGATYFRLDAKTGEPRGQFDTIINSATEPGRCEGPLLNLRELPDGRLIGKISSFVPAVLDITTATIIQLARCGEQSVRIDDFLDTDDFDAATSYFAGQGISAGRNQEFLDQRPYLGTGTFVEAEGDLWWLFSWGSDRNTERWRSAAVVRFDLETNLVVDMWPVGKAADFFAQCDIEKPGCVSRPFDNLAWVDGKLIADYEFRSGAAPELFIFDPVTGDAETFALQTVPEFEPEDRPLEVLHSNGDHLWLRLSADVVVDAEDDVSRFWIGRFDVATKTLVWVADL